MHMSLHRFMNTINDNSCAGCALWPALCALDMDTLEDVRNITASCGVQVRSLAGGANGADPIIEIPVAKFTRNRTALTRARTLLPTTAQRQPSDISEQNVGLSPAHDDTEAGRIS